MSKFQWSMVVLNVLWFAIVMTLVGYSSSEYSKRMELEAENVALKEVLMLVFNLPDSDSLIIWEGNDTIWVDTTLDTIGRTIRYQDGSFDEVTE